MAYLMRFSASFTTISTGIDASSVRMVFTTLADGAGEKPNMVSADTASSITSLFTATAAPPSLMVTSWAMPRASTLSFRSTMMRWAVFRPMPFTPFSRRSLPEAMALLRSAGDADDKIMRAVLPPTPDTLMSNRYRARSCFDAKPKRVYESSRPPATNTSCTNSFTSFLP